MKRNLIYYAYCVFFLNQVFLLNVETSFANASVGKLRDLATQRVERIYDCGANSLFLLCRISGVDASYKKCLELLPISSKGNSMLEMKQALESSGFNVEALRIKIHEIANLRVPTLMCVHPPKDAIVHKKFKNLGHYLVVVPLDNSTVQIIDYPRAPVIFPTQIWIKHLSSVGITDFPIILCGTKNQVLSEMFSSESEYSQIETACENTSKNRQFMNSQIVIKEGISKDMVAHWDFGDIAEGSFFKHDFTLINSTDKEVHIAKLTKGCTCSAISVDKKVILPGNMCTVTISVSLAGRNSKQSISSTVIFDKRDNLPPIKFLITGNSHPRWMFEPKVVDFGLIERGSTIQERKVFIHTTDYGKNSSISNIKCKSDAITATIMSNKQEDNSSYILNICLDPNSFIGNFYEKIDIVTAGQKGPAISYLVVGEIYSDIIVRPERLFLTPSRSPMGIIYLHQKERKAITLISTKITVPKPNKIEVKPDIDEGSQELQLNVNLLEDKSKQCKGNLQLELRTSDPQKSYSVTIPFFYIPGN